MFLVIRAVRGRGEAEERDRKTGALAREANSLLISTDERIRDAAQEVDFVEARIRPAEVEPLRGPAQARDELKRSFEIRQRLDDAEPEDAATREQMLREIVERLTRAHAVLDAQTERIRQLATSNATRPRRLPHCLGRIDAVEVRLPAGEAALTALDRYAPSASQTVRGNVVEAAQGPCRGSAGRGQRHRLAAGRRHGQGRERHASRARRRDRRDGLLDAIDRLAASIAAAEQQLPGALREAEADLADARATTTETGIEPGSPIAARLSEAERALAAARVRSRLARRSRRSAQHGHRGPAARRRGARGGPRGGRRAPAPRGRGDGIDPHRCFRGGSGRGLRRDAAAGCRAGRPDRLAEAERNLADAEALQRTDPALAAQAAERAERLANEAYRLADDDFNDWDQGGPAGASDVAVAVAATWPARSWAGSSAGSCRAAAPAAEAGAVPRGVAPAAAGGFPGWGGGGGFGSGGFGGGGGGAAVVSAAAADGDAWLGRPA